MRSEYFADQRMTIARKDFASPLPLIVAADEAAIEFRSPPRLRSSRRVFFVWCCGFVARLPMSFRVEGQTLGDWVRPLVNSPPIPTDATRGNQ
jgi:hypothetical protein